MKFKTRIILIVLAAVIAVACFVAAACSVKKDAPPETPPVTPVQPDSLTIYGAEDISVLQGKFFNPFAGVTATAASGKDFSAQIKISGNINTSKAGDYSLVYSVSDGNGNTAEKHRRISVLSNPDVGKTNPVHEYTLTSGNNYNIAAGCGVNATDTTNGSAYYAVDGDFATRWESVQGKDDVNFTVDIGSSVPVKEAYIYWEAAYAKSFEILVSDDGASWRGVKSIEEQTLPAEAVSGKEVRINSFAFEELTARFVRLHCTKRATGYGYSIFELQILGPTGTVVPYEEYPDLFDAENDGRPDWKIVDGQYLVYDLGTERTVNRVRIAFQDNLTPVSYTLSYAGEDGKYTAFEKLYNLPYSSDWFRFNPDKDKNGVPYERDTAVTARYFKIDLNERRFLASAYRVTEVAFVYYDFDGGADPGEVKFNVVNATASSSLSAHGIMLTVDGDDKTYWQNAGDANYQTVDLGANKNVGRVDLYWRGDDGGKGKYYDLQISPDGNSWTTVFRQTHGATAKQSVYVYESARYIRVIDYQSPSDYRYMLEGMVVHSQYPESSGEGKVQYNVALAFPQFGVIGYGNGSYVTGGTDFPSSRLIAYLDGSLRDKPVPSNDWWQGLLIADKGYNMYMNPLTATFADEGLWLTNPGAGYFDGFVPGNGSQTVNVDAHDLAVGYAGMDKNAEVRVTGYSDYGISAVMTDNAEVDKLTVFLSEGTLYAYCIFAEPEKAVLTASDLLGVYDPSGNKIMTSLGAEYVGDGIVVKVITHSGYEGGVRKYKDANGKEYENAKIFEERYYVVSVPEGTRFVMGETAISVIMTEGNYMSVGAVGQKNPVKQGEESSAPFPLEEVRLLHTHGYAFVMDTSCLYSFDGTTDTVTTEFRLRTISMRAGYTDEAYSAYLPHQLEKSDYKQGGYVYESVRGDCRSYEGNSFITKDTFYGIVPTFAEPTDDLYSVSVLYNQLLMVYRNNGGDKAPQDSNLISGDPYWQGKNLHPMAMAAIAADQIGATALRDSFLDKIEYILTDWFTYDPVKDKTTGAYFYYDSEWGTLYYKNSEFGAGVNLADHYFTYGYYTLAAGVLSAYRPAFAEQWGNMIELLIRDYMNPDRDDELFPYMRNFDPFAGHGWAGGYADNNGGNNQESAGEALNSWVGAYLYATATGNEKVRLAAIYGYTTELNAIKHYWFNYFGDFTESYPYGVAGQVYGGSNFYGTFFNGQPLYMYGIHLIPGEEYLTSYALDGYERQQLEKLIDTMRDEQRHWDVEEKDKEINAWQHIFIPIVAIYDADEAIDWYNEVLAKQGNVGNDSEQFNVYWLIHGMKSTGLRTTDIWAENGVSATVYIKDRVYTALCWNPSGVAEKFTFRNKDGVVGCAIVPAHSLVTCNPTENTVNFVSYTDIEDFSLAGISKGTNAAVDGGKLVMGSGGSADWLVAFGNEEAYRKIKITSRSEGLKLFIDGAEIALNKTESGYESSPFVYTFKHTVTITGSNATIDGMEFEKLTLNKYAVPAGIKASSVNDANGSAANVFDGNMGTRWESKHGLDNQWLEIELDEAAFIYQLRIYWQEASAKEYKVHFSQTGTDWEQVYHGSFSGKERTDIINPSEIMKVKFIRIECIARTTDFGFSIFEIELYNFNKPVNYVQPSDLDIADADEIENAEIAAGKIVLAANGSVTYHVDFGDEDYYFSIKLAGSGTYVKVTVGGKDIPFETVADGWVSRPVAISAKRAVVISGSNAVITQCKFENLGLKQINVSMTATASSQENGASGAERAVDGNMGTRWASAFTDDEWLEIELSEAVEIYRMKIFWEASAAKLYKVYFAGEDGVWKEVYCGGDSAGGRTDIVDPSEIMQVKRVRIEGISRVNEYGYSIYEVQFYNFTG